MYKAVCGMENEETTSKVDKDERMDWWRDKERRYRDRDRERVRKRENYGKRDSVS